MAAVGNLIYVVGGNDANGVPTDSIVIYDTVLSSFSDGPTMPTPLARFAMVFVPSGAGGMLYLIGGLTTSDGDASGKVHILNIANGSWSTGPDLITPRYSDLNLAVHKTASQNSHIHCTQMLFNKQCHLFGHCG